MESNFFNFDFNKISPEDKSLLQKGFSDFTKYSEALDELRHDFKVSIFGSARTKSKDENYQLAKEMGELIAKCGYKVITGAGAGIMQAGHEGAGKESAVGFNIDLPFEQSANHIIEGSEYLVTCNYFFTRKVMFVRESDAVIACPGGFGTFDELCEVITLMQTGKAKPMPLVLLETEGGHYWDKFIELSEFLVEYGTVSKEDLSLFKKFTKAEDALEYINKFYSRYHSCEFVGNKLVIRLKEKLPENLLEEIKKEFADFIGDEGLEYSLPLENEINDHGTEEMLRLVMRSNRKQPSTLYKMVMALNKD